MPIRDFRDARVGENPAMDVVEVLLQAGAAVDARDMSGQTPLHLAVRTGCAEQGGVVRALLRAGADPSLRDDPPKGSGAAATASVTSSAVGVTPLEAAKEALSEQGEARRSGLAELPPQAAAREAAARGYAACAAALRDFDASKQLVAAYQRLALSGSVCSRCEKWWMLYCNRYFILKVMNFVLSMMNFAGWVGPRRRSCCRVERGMRVTCTR